MNYEPNQRAFNYYFREIKNNLNEIDRLDGLIELYLVGNGHPVTTVESLKEEVKTDTKEVVNVASDKQRVEEIEKEVQPLMDNTQKNEQPTQIHTTEQIQEMNENKDLIQRYTEENNKLEEQIKQVEEEKAKYDEEIDCANSQLDYIKKSQIDEAVKSEQDFINEQNGFTDQIKNTKDSLEAEKIKRLQLMSTKEEVSKLIWKMVKTNNALRMSAEVMNKANKLSLKHDTENKNNKNERDRLKDILDSTKQSTPNESMNEGVPSIDMESLLEQMKKMKEYQNEQTRLHLQNVRNLVKELKLAEEENTRLRQALEQPSI
ncbi:hypothetical protein QTN25_001284 [Entamoeba marina]